MTLPTPTLDALWPDWVALYDSFGNPPMCPLAAPFWSAADKSYLNFTKRFMLVGRATAKDYGLEVFANELAKSFGAALEERKQRNRDLVADIPKRSAFWKTFAKGSRLCGSTASFENAVWTNLGKIGFSKRDIDDQLFSCQEKLAGQTLQAELQDYDPTIVHFAVGKLGGRCIYQVTGSSECDWEKEEDVWVLDTGHRKFLWTRHPNRAPRAETGVWEAKLLRLIGK